VKAKEIMLIAGEPSGDWLASELVQALRSGLTVADAVYTPDLQPLKTGLEPRFFGAGGPCMQAAGVELALDMTADSAIGPSDAAKVYLKLRRAFHQLLRLAIERQPDAIVCVDFGVFNRRFAHAIRRHARRVDWFHDWQPKLVQYISPQVWASREGRAYQIARDYDLVLSIFPFEQEWYARRVPHLHVEFVGHPLVDRYPPLRSRNRRKNGSSDPATVLFLPGSRRAELKRHLPVMMRAWDLLRRAAPGLRAQVVLPNDGLAHRARALVGSSEIEIRSGGLPEALARADVAIAKTGTVSLECAFLGVPAVTMYRTSWITFELAKRIAKVNSATMPNLLAEESVFPEFLQDEATPENISRAALELLQDEERRAQIKTKLAGVVSSLGGPGANRRAAQAIVRLIERA
jgi:lipid-A-disaccharide synthase